MSRVIAVYALGIGAASVIGLMGADLVLAAEPCTPWFSCPPQAAPGPLIGVGLPLAGAALATLLIVRRFRRKE